MPVQAIIFYDILINLAQCAMATVNKVEGSNGAVLVVAYGDARIDTNLPESYPVAFAKWQELMRGLQSPKSNQHQHGDLPPHSH